MQRIILNLALAAVVFGPGAAAQTSADEALDHARELLGRTPLIDGHNDLPLTIRNFEEAPMDVIAYDLSERTPDDTDLPRLREGQVGAQFWSVYISPDRAAEEGYAKWQLEQIDIAHRMIERYPDTLELAITADDIERIFAAGKIASLLGMEGGYGIENSLGALRSYYRLGVRYMTLTHRKTHDWADSANDTPRHEGLSAFGEEVVREMNRLGMLIDLSHVSPRTMHDVLDVSEAPVIFSHSSAYALTKNVRNVPDDVLKRMRENGGIVMVTFIPEFVSEEVRTWREARDAYVEMSMLDEHAEGSLRERYANEYGPVPEATLADVADHIEYVRDVAGIDHVAIGSDYYASGDMPVGLEDVSTFPHLIAELVRRGWSDRELRKLIGENALRTLRDAEKVAAGLQRSRPASTIIFDEP